MQKSEVIEQVEEAPVRSIALAFDAFGVGSHPEDWYCSDYLKAYHRGMYGKIQASNCDEIGERLLVELMVQVSSDDSEHKERVLDWIEGLRELKNAPELRTTTERPNMKRGQRLQKVVEGKTPWRD